jgi:HK97 gp10 family phage protein
MTVQITMEVVGGPALARKLARVSDALATRMLGAAVLSGAQLIRNAAEQKAPKRTRTLARSIHVEPTKSTRTEAEATVGTNLEYAKIHEFGGTIVPRNAKALAVPISREAKLYAPRDFPGKLHVVVKDGKAFLVGARGGVHYALLKSVTLPARPYLRPAFDEKRAAAVREIRASLRQMLAGVAR